MVNSATGRSKLIDPATRFIETCPSPGSKRQIRFTLKEFFEAVSHKPVSSIEDASSRYFTAKRDYGRDVEDYFTSFAFK